MVRLEIQPVRCNHDSQPLTPASGLSYTLVVRFLPQPQRASPPRQLELTPPGAAEFVICDHTIEFLFRDAKQFTGLSDCQARSKAKLDFHFNASLSAVNIAKLEARQQQGDSEEPISMASLKRRAFNQHLLDRIVEHLANGQSLEKSSPDYEALCNYGVITKEAA